MAHDNSRLNGRLFLCLKMGLITKQHTYVDNDPIVYSDMNANWDALYNLVNGGLDDANIAAGAGIDPLKISGGAVTLATQQTISGQKTLVKPIVNALQNPTVDAFAGTMNIDMSLSNLHQITLGGNTALTPTNVSAGQTFALILNQDATGSRLVTWWGNIKWVAATPPTLTTTPSRADIFVFYFDGTNYYGSIFGLNFG